MAVANTIVAAAIALPASGHFSVGSVLNRGHRIRVVLEPAQCVGYIVWNCSVSRRKCCQSVERDRGGDCEASEEGK